MSQYYCFLPTYLELVYVFLCGDSNFPALFFLFSAGQHFPPHRHTLGEFYSGRWSPRQLHIPVQTGAVFCPGFQKGRVPSEKGTLAR